ncbi:hypothetical protein [Pedobacter sp. V48]|uniref:hypothetical protein n=1 Tax=Pedobacter sp. V48 TaxID=509635 RepID=UPI0003E4D5B7|nr:hypothetical protein [Pedobacter sp. V48]ETZ20157.1 hypothetical protein N824_08060 [Pedobacter sp. V48]
MDSIEVSEIRFRRLRNALILLFGVLMLITATAPGCRAQTWAEWFKQKKTQQKYLVQQIAALQVYIGYAKKGYEIVGSGLQTVRDISNGEFNLHHVFISGLKQVSPAIRTDVRIAELVALQFGIVKNINGLKSSGGLSTDQLIYVVEVANEVISECYHDLEELLLIITSGKLEMKDDERLSRLNEIYERMLDKSAFVQDFCGEVNLVSRQRALELETTNKLRRYYEIE